MSTERERLEYLRGELRAERISYGELSELQDLVPHIAPNDVELLEAAGVPEDHEPRGGRTMSGHTPGPWAVGHTVSDRIKVYSVPVRAAAEAAGRSWSDAWVAQPLSQRVSAPGGSTAERDANARLIAAAPALYAALATIVRVRDEEHEGWPSAATWSAARAALALVDGKEGGGA